ncbi:MAG: hypothetical protein IAE81_12960 [Caldilineaceae bacterium]|jgi:hypothetical protein|nr:hypothetical protein [Caldilineaceae bacterium]
MEKFEKSDAIERAKTLDTGRAQAEQRIADAKDWKQSEAVPRLPGDSQPSEKPAQGSDDLTKRGEIFRYYDPDLHGEVRTIAERPQALEHLAVARVHGRDGSVRPCGSLRYSIEPDGCTLKGYQLSPANFGVESALISEAGEQARAQGKDSMLVWAPDAQPDAATHWSRHGFQPEQQRAPSAAGSYWQKKL